MSTLNFAATMLAVGALFALLVRTRRPALIVAGLVLVSLVAYLRPGPGGQGVTFFSLWALGLFWVCIALERVKPRNRYAFFSDEALKSMTLMPFRAAAVVLIAGLIVLPCRMPGFPSLHMAGRAPVWLQVALAVLLADLAVYWLHRAQHIFPAYWRFHAPHHATRELSVVANHRTNILELAAVQLGSRIVIFNLLGIGDQAAIASNVIAYTIAGTVSHANLDFPGAGLRWLNWMIVTPNVHALHHGLGQSPCNFGETFSFWDVLFGTFVMPLERTSAFGIKDAAFTARGIVAQHLHAFTTPRRLVRRASPS